MHLNLVVLLTFLLSLPIVVCAQSVSLNLSNWQAHNVDVEPVTYKRKEALHVLDKLTPTASNDQVPRLVILRGSLFRDGVIELELAGDRAPNAPEGLRGDIGVAFHIAPDVSKFECFYLRMQNGRANDQVRRNHSAQYIAFPEFPWSRLRAEFPEKYESYVDLVPGEWTKVSIEVRGSQGRLFVHGNSQPTIIVNDLKLTGTEGAVGLRIGPGTLAYFSGIKLAP